MSKLKRRDIAEQLQVLSEDMRPLDRLARTLDDQHSELVAIRRKLEAPSPDLDRLETLLNGVKLALERMGGNVMPSAVQDIHALRDQMAEFRQEMAGYRGALMRLTNWLDEINQPPPVPEQEWLKPKRSYNRKKKVSKVDQSQMEISGIDAASHNEPPEVEDEV